MNAIQREDPWKYIQPELMSTEELLYALQERNVNVEENVRCNKQQLVDLFKRIAMPFPQRTCFRKKVSSSVKMDVDPPQYQKNGQANICRNTTTYPHTEINLSFLGPRLLSTTKIKLKRPANEQQIASDSSHNSPTPRKREKITWP